MNPHVLLTSLKTIQRDTSLIIAAEHVTPMKYAAQRINGLLSALIAILEDETARPGLPSGKALSGREVFGLYVKALASQNRFLQARSWEELQPDSQAVYEAFAHELSATLAPLPEISAHWLEGIADDVALATKALRDVVHGYQSLLNDTHLMWWDANPDAESAQELEQRKQALDVQAQQLLGEEAHD